LHLHPHSLRELIEEILTNNRKLFDTLFVLVNGES